MATIALLHGPNLNLLGQREPHIYGTATLADYEAAVAAAAAEHGHTVEAFQSNHEGALVDAIHAARSGAAAIIINPGAFTHYSWAIHDALSAFAARLSPYRYVAQPCAEASTKRCTTCGFFAIRSIRVSIVFE